MQRIVFNYVHSKPKPKQKTSYVYLKESIQILTGCNVEYVPQAIALADRLKLFNLNTNIVPFNWTPSLYFEEKNRSHMLSKYSFVEGIHDRVDVLPMKLAAIKRSVVNAPVGSHVLWLDADTLVLGDVTQIVERSARHLCQLSVRVRDYCSTHLDPVTHYAAGVISIAVSNLTRLFFSEVYRLSLTNCCTKLLGRRPWFQDQLALFEAMKHSPGIQVCHLNHSEMFVGPPHYCHSPGVVGNATITFSGRPKTRESMYWEKKLLNLST